MTKIITTNNMELILNEDKIMLDSKRRSSITNEHF